MLHMSVLLVKKRSHAWMDKFKRNMKQQHCDIGKTEILLCIQL